MKCLSKIFLSVGLLLLAVAASAQTITFTNGVQKFTSLTSTTVNLNGRCELWVLIARPGCVCLRQRAWTS